MVIGFSLEIRFPQQRRHPCCKGPDAVMGVGVGTDGPLVTCPQVVHMDKQQHSSDDHTRMCRENSLGGALPLCQWGALGQVVQKDQRLGVVLM